MRWILALICCVSFGYGENSLSNEIGRSWNRLCYKSKVYDCFLFFNELEVLEIRLHELDRYVDKFVIVEAAEGFRGYPKPYNFEREKERFAQFLDKIIYIKLDEHIETDNPWIREHWQRNQIMRGLTECAREDLILISDVDEIIPGAIIPRIHQESAHCPMIGFWQPVYRWFLNRMTSENWAGPAALRYRHLMSSSPQEVRDLVRSTKIRMEWCGGWHFTSMGGYERIKEKYLQYSHGSDQPINYEGWRACVNETPLVEIDESYPQFVRDNIQYLIDRQIIDVEGA